MSDFTLNRFTDCDDKMNEKLLGSLKTG